MLSGEVEQPACFPDKELALATNLYEPDFASILRNLLEDYEIVATRRYMVLVPGNAGDSVLRDNVAAAVQAATLQLSSIDYTKRRYGHKKREGSGRDRAVEAYTSAYRLGKDYMLKAINRLRPENKELPTAGVFGASLVLERAVTSFQSAHFLYRLGHK